jgi:hypothetical protein
MNPFETEKNRETLSLLKSILVEIVNLKEQIISLKKIQNITRQELRNIGKLKPIKKV